MTICPVLIAGPGLRCRSRQDNRGATRDDQRVLVVSRQAAVVRAQRPAIGGLDRVRCSGADHRVLS